MLLKQMRHKTAGVGSYFRPVFPDSDTGRFSLNYPRTDHRVIAVKAGEGGELLIDCIRTAVAPVILGNRAVALDAYVCPFP